MTIEKRRELRLPLEVRVQLQQGNHVQTHLCSDVSSGGLFVRTEDKWRTGERLTARIFLPGVHMPVVLLGEVVRGAADGIGVRFVESNRELQRFCSKRGGDVLERAKRLIVIAHAKSDMRYFLHIVLASEGYRLLDCESLPAFEAALRESKPDLVVVDPLMTDDEGATLAERLQPHAVTCPVIMVTEGEVVGDAAYLAGDFALVREPVELASFRNLVETLTKR